MGRLIILPLRVSVEIPELEGEPITLPEIRIPDVPPAPPAGGPARAPIPAPAPAVTVYDLSGQLPRDPANTPAPANAHKGSLTIHWLGGTGPQAPDDQSIERELASIARFHIQKDWGGGFGGSGIMYHEAIAPSGTVYVLRDPFEVVWHAGSREANLHSRAVLVMCSEATPPTDAQLRALQRRTADFAVPVFGHQEWSPTACPGARLMEVVRGLR